MALLLTCEVPDVDVCARRVWKYPLGVTMWESVRECVEVVPLIGEIPRVKCGVCPVYVGVDIGEAVWPTDTWVLRPIIIVLSQSQRHRGAYCQKP